MSDPLPAPAVPIVGALPLFVAKTRNPRHILIIEDSLDSVHTMVLLLRDIGHSVDYAINGYVGLDLARRMKPDFVFLDVGLPGLDGYEICKRSRADAGLAGTTVVSVSAYSGEEHQEKSRAAGSHLHLVKPVLVHVLEEILASL